MESFVRQTVDLKNEDSICAFIRKFKSTIFDQGNSSQNIYLKRSGINGLMLLSNIMVLSDAVSYIFENFIISP